MGLDGLSNATNGTKLETDSCEEEALDAPAPAPWGSSERDRMMFCEATSRIASAEREVPMRRCVDDVDRASEVMRVDLSLEGHRQSDQVSECLVMRGGKV